MPGLRFSKVEGLGNDFVLIKAEAVPGETCAQLAQRICDRNCGVGADGLITYLASTSPQADFEMRLFNADGSEAEISGNGLRGLAAYLCCCEAPSQTEIRIATRAGVKQIRKTLSAFPNLAFEVEMGLPILDPSRIPFHREPPPSSLVGCQLPVGEKSYPVTITSMGNPHCSIFVENFDGLGWQELGSRIERHPAFPQRTNVEFIRVMNCHEIEVRFWERGVGVTRSSGTGSCAAAVASILNAHTERKLRVHTAGGSLEIEWRTDGSLLLNGPARVICEGEYFDYAS